MSPANSFSISVLTKSDPGDLFMSKPLSVFSMVAASKLIASLLLSKAFSSTFTHFLFI